MVVVAAAAAGAARAAAVVVLVELVVLVVLVVLFRSSVLRVVLVVPSVMLTSNTASALHRERPSGLRRLQARVAIAMLHLVGHHDRAADRAVCMDVAHHGSLPCESIGRPRVQALVLSNVPAALLLVAIVAMRSRLHLQGRVVPNLRVAARGVLSHIAGA